VKGLRILFSLGTLLVAVTLSVDIFSQTNVPRFESAPCPVVPIKLPPEIKPECGGLIVAQDRAKPGGRSFRLAVLILRAVPASSDPPVVMLHGGPSGPGGIFGGETARAISWVPKLRRDIIIYDQRGAGLSEPKLCPEVFTQPERYLQAKTDKEREEVGKSQSSACVASLKANGIDPDMFGSDVNAQDLADLRKVLGISKWDLFGVSYGGRLVQEALRRDPDGVRSVLVHSPSIIGAGSESDMPLTRQRLLEHVVAACKAEPECASAFPTFEKDFYTVYEELNRKPLDVTIDDARGPIKIRLDGSRFLRTSVNPSSVRVSKMPLLVNELLRGDRNKAAVYMLQRRVATGVANNVLTELVGCYDGFGPVYAKASHRRDETGTR
jgi:pimeloyl-ACP methyl ester carboxylesterase